jgi:putative transposase
MSRKPSPTWCSISHNEAIGIAAIDIFVAVSASFRLLYVVVILAQSSRKLVRFDLTQHPMAAWLSQQAIEMFPWDLDQVVIFNERHLRHVLASFVDYYHRTRTHLSLDKDFPHSRPIQPRPDARIITMSQVGGLHHRYERLAA